MIRGIVARNVLANGSQSAHRLLAIVALTGAMLALANQVLAENRNVSYSRDIRPLLSNNCFLCHGPSRDSEDATDLRLDLRASAVDEFEAIVPGESGKSELLARITSKDPDEMMPPPNAGKHALAAQEIDLIRRWIDQGAEYEQHWAFIPPTRPATPSIKQPQAAYNAIDHFVLKRLEQEELAPARQADRRTLIRRVSLDLIGLPPTPAEVEAFVNDPLPNGKAYERVVDRLLKSDRYGEQMARYWLDAARYADTSGYQYDRERTQWVWRDWVINAFNTNMPFDRFTIEQTAGDLLPDATEQTILATGFHRNHPITIEGGVIDEEYRSEYVTDRLTTTATTWLGMTITCARCHDHMYDPISQEDFYRFYAFFNNVPESGLNGFHPMRKIPSPLDAGPARKLDQQIAALQKKLLAQGERRAEWEQRLRAERHMPAFELATSAQGARLARQEDGSYLVGGKAPPTDTYELTLRAGHQPLQTMRLEALTHPTLTAGSTGRGSNGNFVLSEIEVAVAAATEPTVFQPVKIVAAQADYQQGGWPVAQAIDGLVGQGGWAVDGHVKHEDRTAEFTLAKPIPANSLVKIRLVQEFGGGHQIGRFRLSFSPHPPQSNNIRRILAKTPEQRGATKQAELLQFLATRYGGDDWRQQVDALAKLRSERSAMKIPFPPTMILSEMSTPRTAYVLDRGEYDKPRKDKPLQPGIPAALGPLPDDAPRNRLGLARWLVSHEQPLTARVTVNRYWQQIFGVGLVKTSEDFGLQGDWPSHPELLDWLAVEFMDSGWDVKHVLKTIVMSRTYRQSSHIDEKSYANDPENRLLARGPRLRLAGEVIRDSALAISGALDKKIGGPSVYPYHPQGLWLEINNRPGLSRAYPHAKDQSQLYRRSVYTFWKRTVPPPSMATFDAPEREYCVVRRSRTNTPLQAFVMLHDPQFVEAARHLAARMVREGGTTPERRIQYGFKLTTGRPPNEAELAVLKTRLRERLSQYQADPAAARKLLQVGHSPRDEKIDLTEQAAYTQIARMLLNLSEFLTKG